VDEILSQSDRKFVMPVPRIVPAVLKKIDTIINILIQIQIFYTKCLTL